MADIFLGSAVRPGGPFGIAEDTDIIGGYREVVSVAARDAIITPLRKEGMLVTVTSPLVTYILDADLVTWNTFTPGGGGGGFVPWTVTAIKTSAYSPAVWETVRVDPTGGAFTITLPTAASISGQQIKIKNISTSVNTVTIDGFGSETVDGSLAFLVNVPFECVTVESDGTNWMVV